MSIHSIYFCEIIKKLQVSEKTHVSPLWILRFTTAVTLKIRSTSKSNPFLLVSNYISMKIWLEPRPVQAWTDFWITAIWAYHLNFPELCNNYKKTYHTIIITIFILKKLSTISSYCTCLHISYSTLGKTFSKWHFETFFLFFAENRFWHFRQIVFNGDN